jgi:hypothetical protein
MTQFVLRLGSLVVAGVALTFCVALVSTAFKVGITLWSGVMMGVGIWMMMSGVWGLVKGTWDYGRNTDGRYGKHPPP